MGLIRAGAGAVGGLLADQWKEFFYCESMDKSVMVVKGQKRVSGRSSNTKGSDNIISNGSGIAVADGQCMMIVEQGKVVEVPNQVSSLMIPPANQVFLQEILEILSRILSNKLGNVSLMVAILAKISVCIILIQKN